MEQIKGRDGYSAAIRGFSFFSKEQLLNMGYDYSIQ